VNSWTTRDIALLREHAGLGVHEVARLLGRSESSVQNMARRLRISTRRPGSRKGLVLGQPRGYSFAHATPELARFREDVLSGRVDAGEIAQTLTLDDDAELCPCCGRRPVEVKTTGFCRACHLAHLRSRHLTKLAELEEEQRLWAARQELHRARQAAASGEPERRLVSYPSQEGTR